MTPPDVAADLNFTDVQETMRVLLRKATARSHNTTLASVLNSTGRALNPLGGWPPRPTEGPGRLDPSQPYTDRELAHLLDTAWSLREPYRSRELVACICLTAGAGFTSAMMRGLRWSAVSRDEAGVVWVAYGTSNLPVRPFYAEELVKVQALCPTDAFIFASRRVDAISELADYARRRKVPNWSASRATTTWRVHQLNRLPLPVVLAVTELSASYIARLAVARLTPVTDTSLLVETEPESGSTEDGAK